MTFTRRTSFGFPTRARPSPNTFAAFKPTLGWTDAADVDAQPGSMVSGQNVVVHDGRLEPRRRLTQLGSNTPTTALPVGTFEYDDLLGTKFPVVASTTTFSYFDAVDNSWVTLHYESGASNHPPSGGIANLVRGTTAYLPRVDLNIAIFTNGVDPLFAWGGPTDGTAFSTLTQSPIAKDVTNFDNRPVAWNTLELSSSTRFVTRVRWPAAGNPEGWALTNVGAGTEDLLDARGAGTRIFATGDELILATTEELWRGRRVGLPFTFQFSPISKKHGMPFPRAAIQTPLGIFWLGRDFMVWRFAGGGPEPVGQAILQSLRDTLASFESAFFSYDNVRQRLSLYYTADSSSRPQRAFGLHVPSGVWTPQRFAQQLVEGFTAQALTGDGAVSATTWDGLVGTLDEQVQTYEQTAGGAGGAGNTEVFGPAVVSSNGTAYNFSSTASLDDGAAVTAQWVSGGLLAGAVDVIKIVDEVRLDARADSASSISVAISGNLGGAYATENEQVVSVGSQTSQIRVPAVVSGQYHAIRLTSEDTGWAVSRAAVRGQVVSRADF